MFVVTTLLFLTLSVWLCSRQKVLKPILSEGKRPAAKAVVINGHRYQIEQAEFSSAKEGYFYYCELIRQIYNQGEIQQAEFDLYDFSNNLLHFKGHSLLLSRHQNQIQLALSDKPFSAEQFKLDNPLSYLKG